MPGETIDEALKAVAALRDSGRFVTVDYLGEDITDSDAADATVAAYLGLLGAVGQVPTTDTADPLPFEVSLKLSALGQALPRDGEKIALENAHIHLHEGPRGRRLGDRRRRGPHHHRLDVVHRARTAGRLPLARHGSAGLPDAHRGRLP